MNKIITPDLNNSSEKVKNFSGKEVNNNITLKEQNRARNKFLENILGISESDKKLFNETNKNIKHSKEGKHVSFAQRVDIIDAPIYDNNIKNLPNDRSKGR